MSVPEHLADEMLAKCARHCCICRRFEPLHLQVHHIVERSEGGDDTLDNIIAVCLTCHSDVHTQTKLTRRFTVNELKQHREQVSRLVEEGKLGAGQARGDAVEDVLAKILLALGFNGDRRAGAVGSSHLSPAAVRVLVEAAQDCNGTVWRLPMRERRGIQTNKKQLCEVGNARSEAEYEDAIEQLVGLGLLKARGYKDENFRVTHRGYLLADEILAAGSHSQRGD